RWPRPPTAPARRSPRTSAGSASNWRSCPSCWRARRTPSTRCCRRPTISSCSTASCRPTRARTPETPNMTQGRDRPEVRRGPASCHVRAVLEQPELGALRTAQGVVREHDATDPAILRERAGLRLDLLRGEDPGHRGQRGVAVEQLEITRELLDTVDLAASFDLDGDGLSLRVAAEDVDRSDRGHVLPADQGVTGPE